MINDSTDLPWFKSSYSPGSDDCVEVANLLASHGSVALRDSKKPLAAHLTVAPETYDAFVSYVKRG